MNVEPFACSSIAAARSLEHRVHVCRTLAVGWHDRDESLVGRKSCCVTAMRPIVARDVNTIDPAGKSLALDRRSPSAEIPLSPDQTTGVPAKAVMSLGVIHDTSDGDQHVSS